MRTITSYQEFMKDPSRKRSPEVDFGAHWRLAHDPGGYPWRVSWIERTGELYAVELGSPERDRRVIVLGHYPNLEEVEAALEGWASKPFQLGPLVNPAYLARTRA